MASTVPYEPVPLPKEETRRRRSAWDPTIFDDPVLPKPPPVADAEGTDIHPVDDPQGQTLPIDEPADPWAYTAATDRSSWDSNEWSAPAWTPTRYNPTAISGYDATKWGSATHQTPKYVVGRILSGYNLNDPGQLQAAMNDIIRAYPGTTWEGGDTINFPGIGRVDVIRDFGGESGIAWQPWNAAAAPPGAAPPASTANPMAPGAAPGSATGLPPSSSSALNDIFKSILESSSSSTATSTNPVDEQLKAARRQALLDMLNSTPPTPEELQASPENRAYQLQAQRAMERDRAELAADAAYQGYGDSGYFDTELGGLRQERAEGEAGFLGQLAVTRLTQQRDELKYAIAQAQQDEQFDLAYELDQKRLVLDAAIKQEELEMERRRQAEVQRQFNNRLGYDYTALAQEGNLAAYDRVSG